MRLWDVVELQRLGVGIDYTHTHIKLSMLCTIHRLNWS